MGSASLRRIVAAWLLVIAASAAALALADRVPALLAGTPHGVRVYASVVEAERAVGARVWLPTAYPDALAWPPTRVDAWPGPPATVAVHVSGRRGGRERLAIVQSLTAPAAPPAALLPRAELLTATAVSVGRRTAMLTRAMAPGGEVVHDVSWDQGSRRFTLRYYGPVEELLSIAASLERTAR